MTTKEGTKNTKLLNFAIAIHSFRHAFSVSGFYLKYLNYHTRCNKGYSLIHLEGQFICVLLLNFLLLDYKITSIIDRLQLMTSHFVTVWSYNRLRGGGCTYTRIWSYDGCPSMVTWLLFGHSATGLHLWLFTSSHGDVTVFYNSYTENQHLLLVFGKTGS